MLFELHNLAYAYGGHQALNIERLDIPDNQVTAIVAPNGAGKSTLLEILALLRRPTAGAMRFRGMRAEQVGRSLRRQVVLVKQPGCLFAGTVWGNAMYGLRARRIPRRLAHRQAHEVLDIFGLLELKDVRVDHLSTGQRQRVNLARAMVLRPQVLLLDEPTANTDADFLDRLRVAISRLMPPGAAIIHGSPCRSVLGDLTDRVVELQGGRVVTQHVVSDSAPHGAASLAL